MDQPPRIARCWSWIAQGVLPPLLLLISLCLSAPAIAAGERVALVIGNARYEQQPKLSNPEKDATAVADVLRKIGFAVEQHDNLGRAAMLDTLLNFADRSRDAEVTVIYYAGHGVQVARDSVAENYLVPVDAALTDVRKVADETLPLSRVLNELGDRRGVLILLLDACRDNPLAAQMSGQGSRAVTRSGLAPIAEGAVSQGSLVAFAAGAGKLAEDGAGSNSPFAAALVKNLTAPGIDVGRVMQWVALDVAEATGHKQQPEVVNRLLRRDELYLAAPSPALAPAVPSASPSPPPATAPAMASARPTLPSGPGDATAQYMAGSKIERPAVSHGDAGHEPTNKARPASLASSARPVLRNSYDGGIVTGTRPLIVRIGGTFAFGDTIQLIAHSDAVFFQRYNSIFLEYDVKTGDNAATIAWSLVDLINKNYPLELAGIKSSIAPGASEFTIPVGGTIVSWEGKWLRDARGSIVITPAN